MNKFRKVACGFGINEFNTILKDWQDDGWVVIPESLSIDNSGKFACFLEREVIIPPQVNEGLSNSIGHRKDCGCTICR
jgi:hypothetical protein